jgi:hypothetical protein
MNAVNYRVNLGFAGYSDADLGDFTDNVTRPADTFSHPMGEDGEGKTQPEQENRSGFYLIHGR